MPCQLLRSSGDCAALRPRLFFLLFFLALAPLVVAGDAIFERKVLERTFADDAENWEAEQNCREFLRDGVLCVEAVGGQPILSRSTDEIGGLFRIVIRMKTAYASSCEVLWTTKGRPRRDEESKVVLPLNADGQWNAYEFELSVPDVLTSVAFRFTRPDGVWEMKSFELYRRRSHPLSVKQIVPTLYTENNVQEERLRYTVANVSPVAVSFRIPTREEPVLLEPLGRVDLLVPVRFEGNLAAVNLRIEPEDFPNIDYPVFLYRPEGQTDWIQTPLGAENKILEIAPDARLARIRRGEEVVAILAPLVHRNGVLPSLSRKPSTEVGCFEFEAPEVSLRLDVQGESIRFRITDKLSKPDGDETSQLEGPVVRLFGSLRSGLLPGVEFLGPGDESSSPIDLEPPYHDRSQPNPTWLTMPFAVLETEKIGCVMSWNDPTLQPTFSTPNLIGRTADHRMSLIGDKIDATLQCSFPNETEIGRNAAAIRAIRNYVQSRGFPEPPSAPRSSEDQLKFCLDAIQGPLQSSDGIAWSVAVDAAPKPFADILSTLNRLGAVPQRPLFVVSGGSDIANDSIYFLTGRVDEWRDNREKAVRTLLSTQSPDGSFQQRTRFPDVETATTSFGVTAMRALEIMEFVRLTGKKDLFEAVERALEYLKRGEVPRGGFHRDTPLHTPDLLSAAAVTWLFAWAFEYSGEAEYLEEAKRFALSGLPFVYLWSDREIMLYTAGARFGASLRRSPFSFANANPRIGVLYAYAVNILSQFDQTTDWKRLATGILHAAELMQYPDGPFVGCIPESFAIRNQERRLGKLNPASLVSLRLAVEGKLDSFAVLVDDRDRFLSPYPIRFTKTGAVETFDAPPGRPFQILRNGIQIFDTVGSGTVRVD